MKEAALIPRRRVLLGLAALVALSSHNHWISSSRRSYTSALHLAQTVFYILRKSLTVVVRRLLGVPVHPFWSPLEEIVMGTINFTARIGEVTAPRLALGFFTGVGRFTNVAFLGASVQDVDLGLGHGTGDALWITRRRGVPVGSCATIIYFHGGGYAVGSAGMYMSAYLEILRRMEHEHGVQCGVLSIEYPLSPETKFPHNLAFGRRAFDALVDDLGLSPGRVVVAGDSAGGGMALAVAQHSFARRAKEGKARPAVAGLVLVSPWVNHAVDSDSHVLHDGTDCIAGTDLIRDYSLAYCGSHELAMKDPSISFLHAEVHDLPPVLLTLGTREVFHDDIEAFAAKLRRAGKALEMVKGKDCPHIFPMLWPLFFEEGSRTLGAFAEFSARRIRFREQHNSVSCGWADRIFRTASLDDEDK